MLCPRTKMQMQESWVISQTRVCSQAGRKNRKLQSSISGITRHPQERKVSFLSPSRIREKAPLSLKAADEARSKTVTSTAPLGSKPDSASVAGGLEGCLIPEARHRIVRLPCWSARNKREDLFAQVRNRGSTLFSVFLPSKRVAGNSKGNKRTI